ncbi:site-specific integrase [Solidesulfovibrio sp. C21]|uniref:site-specific integrase n=1 Tax=Solidesulfovibrio sp. C21 TaxID=3398613 RepID=UPI0039FD2FD9
MDFQEKHIEIHQKLIAKLKNELLSWEIDHAVKPRKTTGDISRLTDECQNIIDNEKTNLREGRYWEKKDDSINLSKILNLNIEDEEELVKLFCHLRTKYNIKYFEIIKNRLMGDYDSENTILKELDLNIPKQNVLIETKCKIKKSKKLSAAIDDYLQLNESNWKKTTSKDYYNYTNWFLEIVGDIHLEEISHEVMNTFVDTLQKIPAHRNKKPEYRGKTIEALIKMKCKEVISPRTIQNIVEHISSFFKWSITRGYMEINYAQGKFRSRKESRTIFEPYTIEELHKIFFSDYYLKSVFKNNYQYWLPILGCYTGCRINELAQLQRKDVIFSGIPYIKISSTGENQSVKTQAGERDIPLHKAVLNLGFESYVNMVAKNQDNRIFPELQFKNYSYGSTVTRWYADYIKGLGIAPIKQNNKKTFHCWRSTFAMVCKEQDLPERQIHELIGHRDRDMSLDYYAPAYSVEKLYNDVISKLNFRVDTTRLMHTRYFHQQKLVK